MVSSCSSYGCTYRHKKGDRTGLYRFPKNKNLRQLWTMALRRVNWEPTSSSRICGRHFQSGKILSINNLQNRKFCLHFG